MRDVLPAARCLFASRLARVPIVEVPYPFGETCAALIEELDGMALALIEAGS